MKNQDEQTLDVSPLREDEFDAWLPLATGYMSFYKTSRQPDEYRQLWRRLHGGAGLHAFGARLGGQLVGFTHHFFHASCWGADVCYLQDLFVAPSARGMGVGRTLIERVSEQARRAGAPRLYWLTHSSNEVARGLYDQVATHSGFIRYEINMG